MLNYARHTVVRVNILNLRFWNGWRASSFSLEIRTKMKMFKVNWSQNRGFSYAVQPLNWATSFVTPTTFNLPYPSAFDQFQTQPCRLKKLRTTSVVECCSFSTALAIRSYNNSNNNNNIRFGGRGGDQPCQQVYYYNVHTEGHCNQVFA